MAEIVVERRPVTDAIVAALAVRGDPVGDHEAPADTTERYSIVYSLPGGSLEGSLGNPHEMGMFLYQVESYGRSRQQCEWLADQNRRAMLAGSFDPAGWRIMHVDQLSVGGPADEGRDEQNDLKLWCCRDDFVVHVTRGIAA